MRDLCKEVRRRVSERLRRGFGGASARVRVFNFNLQLNWTEEKQEEGVKGAAGKGQGKSIGRIDNGASSGHKKSAARITAYRAKHIYNL